MDSISNQWLDCISSTLANNIKIFKQKCELYFSVKDMRTEKQADHILFFTGDEGLCTYNTWVLTNEEKKTWTPFLQNCRDMSSPGQTSELSIFTYNLLKIFLIQADKFNFKEDELKEWLIEQLIIGTTMIELQKKLLNQRMKPLCSTKQLTLQKIQEASINNMAHLQKVWGLQTSSIR